MRFIYYNEGNIEYFFLKLIIDKHSDGRKSDPDGTYTFSPKENELQRYEINKNKSFYQKNDYYTSIILRYPNSYLIIVIQNNNLNIYTESILIQ